MPGFYTKTKWSKYLRLKRYKNIPLMVLETTRHVPNKVAMRWFDENENLVSITYAELREKIVEAFYGERALGVKKGDHVSICAETSAKWAWSDIGLLSIGAVSVAIYPTLKSMEVKHIISDSDSIGLFVDGTANLEKFLSIRSEVPLVRWVVVFDANEPLSDVNAGEVRVLSWPEFLEAGRKLRSEQPDLFDQSVASVDEEDLASLIYTSGTTGLPKGVMLTHRNFLADTVAVSAIATTLQKGEKPWEASSITYMPYAHSYGRTVEEFGLIYNQGTINYVGERTEANLRRAFKAFKPTVMVGVPYLYQKLYEQILDTVATMSPRLQKVFEAARDAGVRYYQNQVDGKKNPLGLKLKYFLLKKLVLNRIRKELGGELQLMVTAAAGISRELLLFFWACGFHIAEGYGLTEASPGTHYSRSKFNSDFRPDFHEKVDHFKKIGSVGPPLAFPGNPYPNIEHKIGPGGELLVRGPVVMKGYYKQPELTRQAIDEEGWLHTGDVGEIDEHGYLWLKGRAKAIIKLSTGKMVNPMLVEASVVPQSRLVAQIVLVGSEKKFLSAIIVPYQKPLKKFAEENGLPHETWGDVIRNPKVQALLKEEIDRLTEEFTDFSRPKRFLISSAMFTEQEGFLTPTLKYKRNKIYEAFREDIDKLYEIDGEFLVLEDRMTGYYDQLLV